jgi:hypothetical protein
MDALAVAAWVIIGAAIAGLGFWILLIIAGGD